MAKKVGKDRSTIYRYENGDIGNMPLELLPPMIEALEMTPKELLSFFVVKSEWLAKCAGGFTATEDYEFNDDEMKLFYELSKYLMQIRNTEDYEETLNSLFTLFKQLNK